MARSVLEVMTFRPEKNCGVVQVRQNVPVRHRSLTKVLYLWEAVTGDHSSAHFGWMARATFKAQKASSGQSIKTRQTLVHLCFLPVESTFTKQRRDTCHASMLRAESRSTWPAAFRSWTRFTHLLLRPVATFT